MSPEFTADGFKERLDGMKEQLDYLLDHLAIVYQILNNQASATNSLILPLEAVILGLRLDLASPKGCI